LTDSSPDDAAVLAIIAECKETNGAGISETPFGLYRALLKSTPALKPVSLGSVFNNMVFVKCPVNKKNGNPYVAPETTDRVREFGPDFILNFGNVHLNDDLLRIPRYGVWEFEYGEAPSDSSVPPGIAEVYNGRSTTSVVLTSRNPSGRGRTVIRESVFKTMKHSVRGNHNKLFMEWANLPAMAWRNIEHGAEISSMGRSAPTGTVVRNPSNTIMITAYWRALKGLIKKIYNDIFFSCDIWNIGIASKPIESFLHDENINIEWLPDQDNRSFIADPFGIKTGNEIDLLCESYEYKTSRGVLTAMKIKDTKPITCGTIMDSSNHMSYPYLISYDKNVYCIPETGEDGEVVLYKAVDFPRKWEKVSTLIKNYAAIDSTVVFFNGYWWLFCTNKNDGVYSKLNIWYSKNLFGPWQAHSFNPVKDDIRSSRPAGTPFIYEGVLFRPAQDCSDDYGGKIVINRVTLLTPQAFREEEAAVVMPFHPYPDGIHTLSALGDCTLLDGKRKVFVGRSWYLTEYKIKEIYEKLF
jgi:hypothetical protein